MAKSKLKIVFAACTCVILLLLVFVNLYTKLSRPVILQPEYQLVADYNAYQVDTEEMKKKSREYMTLKRGKAGSHQVKNGHLAIYQKKSKAFQLKKGDKLSFQFDINLVLPNGQFASIGYILNDQYHIFSRGSFKEHTFVEFDAPEDGEYEFFLWCTCTDTMHVTSLTIK